LGDELRQISSANFGFPTVWFSHAENFDDNQNEKAMNGSPISSGFLILERLGENLPVAFQPPASMERLSSIV
jgi:hypothetical protein